MLRYLYGVLIVMLTLFAGSCKKDLLHWPQVQQLNSTTTYRINNIMFVNDSICIGGGGDMYEQSTILRSADGGYTWTASTNAAAPKEMLGMGISPNGNIYLSGVDGLVLYSGDMGRTWQSKRIDNWAVLWGGSFTNSDTGFFVSSVLQRQSSITRVDANFKIIDEQTFLFGLNKVYMTSASTGYLIGYGAVMKTTDHGNKWNYQDVEGDNFTAMHILGSEIWMCGSNGGIYHTYDGGENWENYRNGNDLSLPRYYLRCIVFKNQNNGWAAGDDGKVIYTKDGGRHWAEYDHFTTNNIRSLTLCPNGDLLAAGDKGSLFRLKTK